jgi:hypothetical protein
MERRPWGLNSWGGGSNWEGIEEGSEDLAGSVSGGINGQRRKMTHVAR